MNPIQVGLWAWRCGFGTFNVLHPIGKISAVPVIIEITMVADLDVARA
jgi:hypothetical protein